MQYLLLNKDTVRLEFHCEQNEYLETSAREDNLDVAHALSLNDTFWIKKADSALCWKDVSLYRNPFNEVISEAAFDGSFSSSIFSSPSPEFSTDGQYA